MLDDLNNPNEGIPTYTKWISSLLSLLATVGWFNQAKSEFDQIRTLKWEYFFDYWNVIDITTLIVSFAFLGMLNFSVITEISFFPNHIMRQFGGLSCFLLWIKIFYWMRLFKSTAYFVTLITATINDIKLFMLIVSIIIIAYANLLYCL